MPTTEQILGGLTIIARDWWPLAVFWHLVIAAFAAALLSGWRPSRRLTAFLLGLPLLSVSIVAWASGNPFNGIVFAAVGLVVISFAFRLPAGNLRIAKAWTLVPGILLCVLGWVYPHFLDGASLWRYLYAAPTGLVPCATLIFVIGLALVIDRLGSRALSVVLGIAGLFYGATGVAQLGVLIDVGLLLGAAIILVAASVSRRKPPVAAGGPGAWEGRTVNLKTVVGSGDRITLFTLPFLAVGLVLNALWPAAFGVGGPSGALKTLSVIILIPGIAIWAWSAALVVTSVPKRKLITTGPYAFVKHPLYTGVAFLVLPSIGFLLDSWLGALIGIVLYVGSRLFAPEEERKLSETFGAAWDAYSKNVKVPWI